MINKVESLLKIAIVGPESTGKSTVANYLAQEFKTFCVPEYARFYCQNLNNQYTLADEINMYYGQLALEEAIESKVTNNILLCDTTILTVKIWCDHLFGKTPLYIIDTIKTKQYDYYLLMDIDLPWQDDPLRDFPEDRAYFMDIWKNELENIKANYTVISGIGEDRLMNALNACKKFLAVKNC